MIGLREFLLIGMVVLVLYGRSGVLRSERAQTIMPWLSPVRRKPRRPASPVLRPTLAAPRPRRRIPGASLVRGNRLYWFLMVLAATAIGAWVVTRTLITSGNGPRLFP